MEVGAQSVASTGVGHDEVLISPFFSQDFGESVVVRDCGNSVISRMDVKMVISEKGDRVGLTSGTRP